MQKIIGIDIGGSTTKIVGLQDNEILSPLMVKATDPIASAYGALGKFMSTNNLNINDIKQIMITGIGSSHIKEKFYGIPTGIIDEFICIGVGGLFLSNLKKAVVVSMGTGTAFVVADGKNIQHLGGTGVGGGTLIGLSSKILNIHKFSDIVDTAANGDLSNIDLKIRDLNNGKLDPLTADLTASNFGKASDLSTKGDLALGIINLIFETIGMLAAFASKLSNTSDVVLTGNLTDINECERVFSELSTLYNIKFYKPINAGYATALGAAVAYKSDMTFKNI